MEPDVIAMGLLVILSVVIVTINELLDVVVKYDLFDKVFITVCSGLVIWGVIEYLGYL